MNRLFAFVLLFALFLTSCTADLEAMYPRLYSETVCAASAEFSVPEYIIYAVIKCESDFSADAVSGAGAQGLMQLMPSTYEWLNLYKMDGVCDLSLITDTESNIRTGTCMLGYLYGIFGNWETVFAAYNAGQGRVSGWLADTRYSLDGVTLFDIPYAETKQYVNRVCTARDNYIKLYYSEEK